MNKFLIKTTLTLSSLLMAGSLEASIFDWGAAEAKTQAVESVILCSSCEHGQDLIQIKLKSRNYKLNGDLVFSKILNNEKKGISSISENNILIEGELRIVPKDDDSNT
ncbi:hypothetical protein N9W41_00220, partial [bacterium]|nr:hypothetical protein [bacterium]